MNISNRLNEFNNESRNHLLWQRGVNMADRDLGRRLHEQQSRWLDLERDISRARGILLYRVIRPADRYIEYLEDREDANFLEEWELEELSKIDLNIYTIVCSINMSIEEKTKNDLLF